MTCAARPTGVHL